MTHDAKELTEALVDKLLQTIDPSEIADESLRQTIEILLNLVEQLNSEVKNLTQENQRLRDENNQLKGEQGKPDIKAKQPRGESNLFRENEKTPKKAMKGFKNKSLKIDRQQILEYPQDLLPVDAEFKGYEEVVVQDIKLTTDNVLFRKQKYYSPQREKTYLAELPDGYEGEFGPGIKALVISLWQQHDPKLNFGDIGISMSAGYLSNLLIKTTRTFILRKVKSMKRDLLVVLGTLTKQLPVLLVNYTTNIVCNRFIRCTSRPRRKIG